MKTFFVAPAVIAIVLLLGFGANTANAQGIVAVGGMLGTEYDDGDRVQDTWFITLNVGTGGEETAVNFMFSADFGSLGFTSIGNDLLFRFRVGPQGEVFFFEADEDNVSASVFFGAGIGLRHLFTSIDVTPMWLDLAADVGARLYLGNAYVFLAFTPAFAAGLGQWSDGDFSDSVKPRDLFSLAGQLGVGGRF